jgi:TRAP-type C4-dicarboxylate transport system permease small subunit
VTSVPVIEANSGMRSAVGIPVNLLYLAVPVGSALAVLALVFTFAARLAPAPVRPGEEERR